MDSCISSVDAKGKTERNHPRQLGFHDGCQTGRYPGNRTEPLTVNLGYKVSATNYKLASLAHINSQFQRCAKGVIPEILNVQFSMEVRVSKCSRARRVVDPDCIP